MLREAGQGPVAARVARVHVRRPYLTGSAAAHKHRTERLPGADLGAHDVPAARCAKTTFLLSEPFLRSRDGITLHGRPLPVLEDQLLPLGVDLDLHLREAKKALSSAPHSTAITPPSSFTSFFSTSFFGSLSPYTGGRSRASNIAARHLSNGPSGPST